MDVKSDSLSSGAGFVDYDMKIVVFYTGYENYSDPNLRFEKEFTIRITDYCFPSVVNDDTHFVP